MLSPSPMPDRRADGQVLPHSRLARYLLPALFGILAAVIGAVTWRFYASQKELTRRAAQSQLLTVADAKVREISQWRKGRLGEAHAFMRSEERRVGKECRSRWS